MGGESELCEQLSCVIIWEATHRRLPVDNGEQSVLVLAAVSGLRLFCPSAGEAERRNRPVSQRSVVVPFDRRGFII